MRNARLLLHIVTAAAIVAMASLGEYVHEYPNSEPPSTPVLDIELKSDHEFIYAVWSKPPELTGDFYYNLTSNFMSQNYWVPESCSVLIPPSEIYIIRNCTEQKCNYSVPCMAASSYSISLVACRNESDCSAEDKREGISTTPKESEEARNLTFEYKFDNTTDDYACNMTLNWSHPCMTNAAFHKYVIEVNSNNSLGYPNEILEAKDFYTFETAIGIDQNKLILNVVTDWGNNTREYNFQAPDGIPPINDDRDVITVKDAVVSFKPAAFSYKYGKVKFYSLLIAPGNYTNVGNRWGYVDVEKSWPNAPSPLYETTEKYWKPQITNDTVNYKLGTQSNCINPNRCNKKLEPGTKYGIALRALTGGGFRDTRFYYFITAEVDPNGAEGNGRPNIPVIIGCICGIMITAFLIVFGMHVKKGKIKWTNKSPEPVAIPLKKFRQYYDSMRQEKGRIMSEYQLLRSVTASKPYEKLTATLPANRRKNRYTNIVPYDRTRVVLTSDSVEYGDYINASYIKGHDGNVEYIATQGPTESTSVDFWRMIWQQTVSVIVMLTSLVEDFKPKCHKYFPYNGEVLKFDDMVVKCEEETMHSWYILRVISITKDNTTKTVDHIHFTEWHDFGCPQSTDVTLQFCYLLKKCREKRPGLLVTHCSAGVGRTGTLLAIDLLLHRVKEGHKVSIFGTVSSLRDQRPEMVQTEEQYDYIYKCVYDAIEHPDLYTKAIDLDEK